MKDERASVTIKEFVGLSLLGLLVANCVNRSAVAIISQNEYKDILLNNKCMRHSVNRIQSRHQE